MKMQGCRNLLFPSLIALFISHLFIDFMLGIWPAYKTLAQLDLGKAGTIAGTAMFLGEISQLGFGSLSDRGHQRILLSAGIFCAGAVSFLSFTSSYLILFLLVLFTYLGSSAFHPSASRAISRYPEEKRGLFYSLFYLFGLIGAALSQGLFTSAYLRFQGNTSMFYLPLIFLGLLMLMLPASNSSGETKEQNIPIPSAKKRSIFFLYLMQVIIQTNLILFCFYLPELLSSMGHTQWFSLGGGYFIFVIGEGLGSLFAGYITLRWDTKKALSKVLVLQLILFYTFLHSACFPFPMTCLLFFLLGSCLGTTQPLLMAEGLAAVPPKARGKLSALLLGGASAIAGLFLIGMGEVQALTGTLDPMALMNMLGLGYVIALGCARSLPKRLLEKLESQLSEDKNHAMPYNRTTLEVNS